ncbi:MAG: OsmC-related (seleno)protein [Candidatus Binatia bacterium]
MLRIDPGVKEELLERIEKRSREKSPKGGLIKVKSRVIHHMQMKAEADGFAFISDEGENVGGYGAGPAPLRYFLAGVMMCHQVWCVKAAALLDARIESVEGNIGGHLSPDGAYSKEDIENFFEKISYEVAINSPEEPAKIIAVVEKAGLRCPAFGTVNLAVPIDLKVIHNGNIILERNLTPRSR